MVPRTSHTMLVALAAALSACSPSGDKSSREMPMDEMMSDDMAMMERMPEWMMSNEDISGSGMMQDMCSVHGLLASHDRIDRRVENIPNGVRTVTTSDDPEVAQLIRKHVLQLKARYERDQPIRMVDPVFRELFRKGDEASLTYTTFREELALPTRLTIHRWCF